MVEPARPELDAKFVQDLLREDELGVVIRAHIHIEASLIDLLNLMVPFPERLPSLRYSQRVELASALGLKCEHVPPLIALGRVRNAFAHKPGAAISVQHVDSLYNALSDDDKVIVQRAFERTKSHMPIDKGPDFRKLEPKDQFVLIAVSLKSMLLAAVHTLHKKIA